MNKAAYILNRVPYSCAECPIEICSYEYQPNPDAQRPEDCPLVREPERKLLWYDDDRNDYSLGFNDCLNSIFGEEEDEDDDRT